MESPLFIPSASLKASSNLEDKDNLRPKSEKPWRSVDGDKLPTIGAVFPERSELGGVDLPKLKNVKSVRMIVRPEDADVNKVTHRVVMNNWRQPSRKSLFYNV